MGTILSLLAGLAGLVGKAIDWFSGKAQRDAGAAQQRDADRKGSDEQEEKAREAQNSVAAAGDDQLDRLRDKWTKP